MVRNDRRIHYLSLVILDHDHYSCLCGIGHVSVEVSVHFGAAALLHYSSFLILDGDSQALLSSIIVGFLDSLVEVLISSDNGLQLMDNIGISIFVLEGNGCLLSYFLLLGVFGIFAFRNIHVFLGVVLG